MRSKRGQVAIEMAAAIIAAFIFLLGTIQIFAWFNTMLVSRQEYYERSRLSAGSGENNRGGYSYTPAKLDIFGTGGE